MNFWDNKILRNKKGREPEEIFKAYCSELGDYYLKNGFKYFNSRPKIERKKNDLVEGINFWSSSVNVKDHYVHLEILPFVKSRSLKKWIKSNGIGRNEFLYTPKLDYPRNIGIFDHTIDDFGELVKGIDEEIILKLSHFVEMLSNLEKFLTTSEFDDEIVVDNFLAYVAKNNIGLVNIALNKFDNRITDEFRSQIIEYLNGT